MDVPAEPQLIAYCESRGVVVKHHCCLAMAYAVAHPVLVEHQGRNRVIDWIASWNEYRIPIAYDGYASTPIQFCPFCGSGLGSSKKDQWYQQLYALGYSDPGEQVLPEQYVSDAWWRNER